MCLTLFQRTFATLHPESARQLLSVHRSLRLALEFGGEMRIEIVALPFKINMATVMVDILRVVYVKEEYDSDGIDVYYSMGEDYFPLSWMDEALKSFTRRVFSKTPWEYENGEIAGLPGEVLSGMTEPNPQTIWIRKSVMDKLSTATMKKLSEHYSSVLISRAVRIVN